VDGTARPDYGRCVDIATKAALQEMALPGFLAILVTLLVGFLLTRSPGDSLYGPS